MKLLGSNEKNYGSDYRVQTDRGWELTSSYDHDMRLDANLRNNYLSMPGSDPSHREVGRQAVSCATCPPHFHPRSVGVVSGSTLAAGTGQPSALVADPLWDIPETRRSHGLTPVACRQAEPVTQPADPYDTTEKAANSFDPGARCMYVHV